MKAVIHGKTVTADRVIEDGVVLFEEDTILAVGEYGQIPIPAEAERFDASGLIVGPGFVDIHCHAGGMHLMSAEPDKAAAHHLHHGTTSLCCTLGYDLSFPKLFEGIGNVRAAMEANTPGNIVGIHLEGPYVAPGEGTNHAKSLPIIREEFEKIGEAGKGIIRQWMYPPEVPNAEELEAYFQEQDIVSAIGHTDGKPEDILRAADAGATIVTHMYDAMSCWRGAESVHETGIIQESVADAVLLCDNLTYEIICDSQAIHVKPYNLKLIYKLAGADRIALITDCFFRGYDPADYPPEHKRSAIDLNFTEDGALYGSTLCMDYAFSNFHRFTGAGYVDMFRMASATPAKAVRIFDTVGSLEAGKKANLVMLAADDTLRHVILAGKTIR